MTQRDMAGYIDVTPLTLRNWKKYKPRLYEIIMKGFAYSEIVELNKKTYEKAMELEEKFTEKKKI